MKLSDESSRRFDALYRRHSDEVFQTCMRFAAGDRAWAMDCAHDVFITLAERLEGLDEHEDLGGWLYRVAANTCLMRLRRQKSWLGIFGAISNVARHSSEMERGVQARRDVTRLEEALAELPPEQRAVMVLVHLDGKSQTEAAGILELSKGYVSKLHQRAVTALRAKEWEIPDA